MRRNAAVWVLMLAAAGAGAEVSQAWLNRVPAKERARVNPYAGQAEAIAAGARLYADHCAACHGSDLQGRGKRPSLRTVVVQGATGGELFWLLRNGDLRHGMPSWSGLPEAERWEIVAYVKAKRTAGSR